MNNIHLNTAEPNPAEQLTLLSDTPLTQTGMLSEEPPPPGPETKQIQVGWVEPSEGKPAFVRLMIGDIPVILQTRQARHLAETIRKMSHFAEGKGKKPERMTMAKQKGKGKKRNRK